MFGGRVAAIGVINGVVNWVIIRGDSVLSFYSFYLHLHLMDSMPVMLLQLLHLPSVFLLVDPTLPQFEFQVRYLHLHEIYVVSAPGIGVLGGIAVWVSSLMHKWLIL